jgi:adenylylsulfate kinase-like enzyme
VTGHSDARPLTDAAHGLGGAVIYLIGIPAVGKYTIAKEIARLTQAKPGRQSAYQSACIQHPWLRRPGQLPVSQRGWDHIETIREAVLSTIVECSAPGDSFVFTNVLEAGDPGSPALFRRIEQVAVSRGVGFFPVWLTCDPETLRQRKGSPDRKQRFTDTDVTNIARYVQQFRVFEAPHPNALKLDTSADAVEAIARRIIGHVQRVQYRRADRAV